MDIEIRIVGPELLFWSQPLSFFGAIKIPDDDTFIEDDSHIIKGGPLDSLLVLDYSRIEVVRQGAVLRRYAIEDCVLKCSGMIDGVPVNGRVLFGEDFQCAGRCIAEVGGHADAIDPRKIALSYKVLYHPVRGYIKVLDLDGIEISGNRVPLDVMERVETYEVFPYHEIVELPAPFNDNWKRFWRIEDGKYWLLNEHGDDVEGPAHVASREHLNLLRNTIEVADGAFRGCKELQTLALGKYDRNNHDEIKLGRDFVLSLADSWGGGVKAVLVSSEVSDTFCRDHYSSYGDLCWNCNLLISDNVHDHVRRLEYDVAGREIHVNEEQFAYLSHEIFDIPENECEHVSGRWIFTPSLHSARWMISFAHRLEEDAWTGSDMALALRCYEHAKWCAEQCLEWWDGGPEESEIQAHCNMEIDRLRDEMEELDARDFDNMGVDRLRNIMHIRLNIVNVRIADGVEFIPEDAFRGCQNLRSVYIPDSVVDVAENAFSGCPGLISRPHYTRDGCRLIVWTNPPEHVVISPYAQIIGMECFAGSENLQEVTYNPVMPVVCLHDEVYRAAILPRAFANCRSLRSVVVDCMDAEASALRTLLRYDINNGLAIGWESFKGCSSLARFDAYGPLGLHRLVLLPIGKLELRVLLQSYSEYVNDMVVRLGRTFEGCEHLEEVPMISSGLSEESAATFRGCRTLRRVSLCCSSYGAKIAHDMFDGCDMLTQISLVDRKGDELPAGVVCVGANAFNGCNSLTNEGINANRLSRHSSAEALAGSRLDIPREEDDQHRDEDDGEEMDAGEGQPEERIMNARDFFGEVEEEDDEDA